MSGLLERIARRGRSSVSGWIGATPKNGAGPAAHANGGPPSAPQPTLNGAQALDPDVGEELDTGVTEELEVAEGRRQQVGEQDHASEPGFRQRGRIRRRARYLRQLRELQLRDIGGFVLEQHRFHRDRPDLVRAKVAGAAEVDRELRALERALRETLTLRELREAGIGGACPQCGAVHGSTDRFCSSCGGSLNARAMSADQPRESGNSPE